MITGVKEGKLLDKHDIIMLFVFILNTVGAITGLRALIFEMRNDFTEIVLIAANIAWMLWGLFSPNRKKDVEKLQEERKNSAEEPPFGRKTTVFFRCLFTVAAALFIISILVNLSLLLFWGLQDFVNTTRSAY